MRIGSVNSTSFNGLWSIHVLVNDARKERYGGKTYNARAVYHPFADETKAQISSELKNPKKPFFGCYDDEGPETESWGPNGFVIKEYKLGSRLNITEKEYMQKRNKIETDYENKINPMYYDPSTETYIKPHGIID